MRAQADPNRFISAAQLGITVASLLLGWLGEETFARLFEGTAEPDRAARCGVDLVARPGVGPGDRR